MNLHGWLKKASVVITLCLCICNSHNCNAANSFAAKKDSAKTETFSGLKFRSIGPGFLSGRIADIAVNPKNHSEWFVAVASGHLWKTTNSGITWQAVFDNYGVYATSCVRYDPNNPFVLWLGTGENNHQRALGYGNGVYKSVDGGNSWKNMGLKDSRQIGNIIIDPRNSDIVYVACEGSVWGPGGERGLYKTVDGGKTWNKILNISDNTGINNVIFDPRNPDVLFASSEQRRRHVFTKIGGGPETAIYKSLNAGASWDTLRTGLPSENMGGIGLAVSPENPDIVYAIIEAANGAGGFFKSIDRGATWKKMSSYTSLGQYYNEIYCDPVQLDKIYSVETITKVTSDGGITWKNVGNNRRHVDDHAMWIDPDNTQHFLIGGDGGLYETFDGGNEYRFISNLPVTQFYRVQADNSLPFYYIYGGTQDNNSVGGPSQNTAVAVVSDDWFVTHGGDGFWSQIDPEDPNIVYCESQYAGMARYNRLTGESIDIRPEPEKDEPSFKWNWNTPLIISSHNHNRLYVAAQKVFRSDDRGNSWKTISNDLTTQTDRNSFQVMGKYWSIDAVMKDVSTSQFGTIISFNESPLKDSLLYAGTDDGVLSITSNGGKTWQQCREFPGIPQYTYISDILASRFDENVVYVSFDNILRDDFKPYILKSSDKGKTWKNISANLPQNVTVHTLQQDHVNADLLFAGTESGVFFTLDGGTKWSKITGSLPDVKICDLEIQQRENDLVVATFGRGIYILDDYTPLRTIKTDTAGKEATIFPVKDALLYIRQGIKDQMGSTYFRTENTPFGATFTYYLKKAPKTLKDIRHAKESKLFKEGKPIPQPSAAELRNEEFETAPFISFIIKNEQDEIVRTINTNPSEGINRINWDLRYNFSGIVETDRFNPTANPSGILVAPGNFKLSMTITCRDTTKELVNNVPFKVKPLFTNEISDSERKDILAFYKKVSELDKIYDGTQTTVRLLKKEVSSIMTVLERSKVNTSAEMKMALAIDKKLNELTFLFYGKMFGASEEENPPMQVSMSQRFDKLQVWNYSNISCITQEQKKAYDIFYGQLSYAYDETRKILVTDIVKLHNAIDAMQLPATPYRLPEWKK